MGKITQGNITQDLLTLGRLTSYIRKGKCRPATPTPTPTPPSRSGYPPWILKWAGVESSCPTLISSIGKTKRIAIFWARKINFQNFHSF